VNQFPCENVLTCKDLLVTVARQVNQAGSSPQDLDVTTGPSWLPLTFNLLYELPQLVRCYLEQEKPPDFLHEKASLYGGSHNSVVRISMSTSWRQ